MIRLVTELPPLKKAGAELVKIYSIFQCYRDIALFWAQDNGRALMAMLDGNMVIADFGADSEELKAFVEVIDPNSIFSSLETLKAIAKEPPEQVWVMARQGDISGVTPSDPIVSREVYELLNVEGLTLPEYAYFATDFCRRLNHGWANCFVRKGVCAAFSVHTGEYALINGIASHQKGGGTLGLTALVQQNYGRTVMACCRESVCGFYEKNGFKKIGQAGYWVK